MATTLPDNQVERWHSLSEEFIVDAQQVAHYKELDDRRLIVQKEMIGFLDSYLAGKINTGEFKITFDRKTRKEWNSFGLKGMSGAMFLNKLVNHIPDQNALGNQLRTALKVPENSEYGQEQMRAFLQFIEEIITSHEATKQQLQPARTPFFISAWWHMQATVQWPIFYPQIRQTLEIEGLYTSSQNQVKDYFAFRDIFLSLATALDLGSWKLEHLFEWYGQRYTNNIEKDKEAKQSTIESKSTEPSLTEERNREIIKVDEVVKQMTSTQTATTDLSQQEEVDEQAVSSHAHIQWELARIGRRLGCHIWIAANDHSKIWNGERLGDLSIKTLPILWMDSEFQRILSLIDVLWLKGTNAVAAAFEVEHTTSIYSGLLRMSDLITLYPNINFPLYIVTPEIRLDKVRRELSRPTFQSLELHKRCGFFSEERLLEEAEAIMRWATNSSAIEKLASRVSDVGI